MIEPIAAFVLDMAFGDPPNKLHPVAWLGKAIDVAAHKAPDSSAARFLYGLALVLLGATGSAALARLILQLPSSTRKPTEVLLLKTTIGARGLVDAADSVASALERGDVENARHLVGWHLVSRDTSSLSPEELAGATVESVAENLTDGLLSPLLYYAVGGLPAAWAYRFVNTCDSMLGYRDEEHEWLGKAAARADDALNWIPARVAAASIVAAAAILGFDAKNAWKTMLSQHSRTASPNAGWTMSAAAGALHVTLSKRGHYSLEGGDRRKSHRTIREAIRLIETAFLLDLALVTLVSAIVSHIGKRQTG